MDLKGFFDEVKAAIENAGEPAPATGEVKIEVPEDLQKAIDDIGNMAQAVEALRTTVNEQQVTLEGVTEALEKTLDRMARLESGGAVRKSLDGSEGTPDPDDQGDKGSLSKAVLATLTTGRIVTLK